MKIFWSWQSDTDGKTGRFFVRDALTAAIAQLKQAPEVEEPNERDLREAIHLDHDRKGVPGTPELASTIFGKIRDAAVVVADVTIVAQRQRASGEGEEGSGLINSNVAIEYGYAVSELGDEFILLVQNTFHGGHQGLPFDLKHKARPIQYHLPPDAPKARRNVERAKLSSILAEALRACLSARAGTKSAAPGFDEMPFTTNRAFFWKQGDLLAQHGTRNPLGATRRSEDDDVYEYRFDELRALYLRLIPTVASKELFTFGELMNIVDRRRVRVMTNTMNGGQPCRNMFGAVAYQSSGTNRTPVALTRLHRNGEIWAITREFWGPYANDDVVTTGAVQHRLEECLANSIEVAGAELGIVPPYQIEIGIVGVNGMRLARPPEPGIWHANPCSDYVHDDVLYLRRVLNEVDVKAQAVVVKSFLRDLYALAAIDF